MTRPTEKFKIRHRPDIRKGVYIVPSLLTTANIFCGFYSVIEALKGFQSITLGKETGNASLISSGIHHFDIGAMCIGWSVLFDFLDGRIARMANATSEFGVELDSIADVLSFGIAPATLAYAWGFMVADELQKLAWATSFMFLVCGALRLARFNVLARKPGDKTSKKHFVGMPIPAGASLIAAIVHFSPTPLILRTQSINILGMAFDNRLYSVMLLTLMILLALLMVSTIRYNNFKGSSNKPRFSRIQLVLIMACVMFAIYQWSQIVLLVMATFYVSLGPVSKLLSLLRPHQSSFTPEDSNISPEIGVN